MPDLQQKIDLRYTIISSPIGKLLIAANGQTIVRVAFENQNFDNTLETLATQWGAPAQHDDKALTFATEQFEEYFSGQRKDFDLPTHQPKNPQFLHKVQQGLANIPYGQTTSYGLLASTLGHPGAARAVGSACARNPMPIIQPCHRVVRSDGTYGAFSGTPGAKDYLLAFERGDAPDAPASSAR